MDTLIENLIDRLVDIRQIGRQSDCQIDLDKLIGKLVGQIKIYEYIAMGEMMIGGENYLQLSFQAFSRLVAAHFGVKFVSNSILIISNYPMWLKQFQKSQTDLVRAHQCTLESYYTHVSLCKGIVNV